MNKANQKSTISLAARCSKIIICALKCQSVKIQGTLPILQQIQFRVRFFKLFTVNLIGYIYNKLRTNDYSMCIQS